jgi:hypothetical protein
MNTKTKVWIGTVVMVITALSAYLTAPASASVLEPETLGIVQWVLGLISVVAGALTVREVGKLPNE